jgi:hypothetical protein
MNTVTRPAVTRLAIVTIIKAKQVADGLPSAAIHMIFTTCFDFTADNELRPGQSEIDPGESMSRRGNEGSKIPSVRFGREGICDEG